MSLSAAINSAQSGLQVNSLRAEIVASNVSNASTPGYVRRSVIVNENLVGGQTDGVVVQGIARAEDTILTRTRRQASSDVGQANVIANAYSTLSTRIGASTDGNSLFNSVETFETSLANLVNSPESVTDQQTVLSSARGLVNQFNDLSALANALRQEADTEIAIGVDVINNALQQVEALNGKISATQAGTAEAAVLVDERDRQLNTIAEYIPIEISPKESGAVHVLTKEGVFLVTSTARTIEFSPSNTIAASDTFAAGDLSGLTVDGIDITPGQASFASVSSGLFGGLFSSRDTEIPAFSAQLDTLATDLLNRYSDDTLDPTKTPGDPGLFVDPDAAAGAGVAGRLNLNAAIDPDQSGQLWRLRDGIGATVEGEPGNTTIVSALSDALTQSRSINENGIQGTFSFAGLSAHLTSIVGQSSVQSAAVASSVNAQHQTLIEAEQSFSAVDVDTELQDLLLIEQAYAANARVIQVASDLIDTLLSL